MMLEPWSAKCSRAVHNKLNEHAVHVWVVRIRYLRLFPWNWYSGCIRWVLTVSCIIIWPWFPPAQPSAASLSTRIASILPSPGSQLESAPGTHQPNNNLTSPYEKLPIPQTTCNIRDQLKGRHILWWNWFSVFLVHHSTSKFCWHKIAKKII